MIMQTGMTLVLEVVIRADGSPEIGSGHIMRCLTLATELQRRGANCRFVCRDFPDSFIPRILEAGFEVLRLPHNSQVAASNWLGEDPSTDLKQTVNKLQDAPPDLLIVDHYSIDTEWETGFSEVFPACPIFVIDDLANRKHACHGLLDPSLGRDPDDYKTLVPGGCTLMIGIAYALLRPDFFKVRSQIEKRETPGREPRVLIALGGGNTGPFLKTIAQALGKLRQSKDFSIRLIGAGPQLASLFPDGTEAISHTNQMAEEINQCDVIICAAGGTNWERVCLGVPAAVLTIADNQEFNSRSIDQFGLGILVENDADEILSAIQKLTEDAALHSEISKRCLDACDGRGVKRAADWTISQGMELVSCTLEDARFVFDARYSGGAERYFKNPKIPQYSDHLAWFESALKSEDFQLFVVRSKGENVAHIRLDRNASDTNRVEVGIALAPAFRGKGLAVPALLSALGKCRDIGYGFVDAEIHRENIASIRLFQNAGFVFAEDLEDPLVRYQVRSFRISQISPDQHDLQKSALHTQCQHWPFCRSGLHNVLGEVPVPDGCNECFRT